MILCINCSADTKAKMDSLLNKDCYRDYSELVSVAIDNMCVLDSAVTGKGAVVISEEQGECGASKSPTKKTNGIKATMAANARGKKIKKGCKPANIAPASVPHIFCADGLEDLLSIPTADIPPAPLPEDTYTLDRWLFGQYNKLLPAKANCRALMRMIAENPETLKLEDAAASIGEDAALLGEYLAEHDRMHDIGRDETLATAFPRTGEEAEKSRARYASQFVGAVNSQGVLSGLLRDYQFAVLAPDKDNQIMLTRPAVQFALMPNPVLDNHQSTPTQKFSQEEIIFLLEHIKNHVPVEAFAFKTLLQAIADGADTPDKLAERLGDLHPVDMDRVFSPSFLTSQRSGALSRLVDLNIIKRVREGVRVRYMVNARGKMFGKE